MLQLDAKQCTAECTKPLQQPQLRHFAINFQRTTPLANWQPRSVALKLHQASLAWHEIIVCYHFEQLGQALLHILIAISTAAREKGICPAGSGAVSLLLPSKVKIHMQPSSLFMTTKGCAQRSSGFAESFHHPKISC